MQSTRSDQFHVTFYGLNETQANEKKSSRVIYPDFKHKSRLCQNAKDRQACLSFLLKFLVNVQSKGDNMNTSTCCRKDPKLVENGTIHESQIFFFKFRAVLHIPVIPLIPFINNTIGPLDSQYITSLSLHQDRLLQACLH